MPVLFDGANSNTGWPPGGFTVSHPLGVAAGNNRGAIALLLLVGNVDHTLDALTYNGVAMDVVEHTVSSLYFGRELSMVIGVMRDDTLPATPGSYNVYAESPEPYDGVMCVTSYQNVRQTGNPRTIQTNVGIPLSGNISTNHTTVAADGLIVDACGLDGVDPLSFSPGTGQTERSDDQRANSALGTSDKPFTGAGVKNMYQIPTENYYAFIHVVVEFVAADAVAGVHNAPIIGANF